MSYFEKYGTSYEWNTWLNGRLIDKTKFSMGGIMLKTPLLGDAMNFHGSLGRNYLYPTGKVEKSLKELIFEIKEYINSISITITDNAGGIPSSVIDTVFNANVTTKEEGKGTGIGLYMSRQIVEKNNGTIKVINTSNGAKFTIKLNKE
jgi:signal transduction histidine kinase